MIKNHTGIVIGSVLFLCAFIIALLVYPTVKNQASVKILGVTFCITSPCSDTPVDVPVTGFVSAKTLNFKVYPEKRIPPINNWSTVTDVTLQNCTTLNSMQFNGIVTNNLGEGTITLPVNPPVLNDNYRLIIKGLSHMKRAYNCYPIDNISETIDVTPENKDLLAGEISIVFNNYINSLDLSVMINNFFTNDVKTDLNQDGIVNSLDLSNQIYNFYKAGD